MNQPNNNLRRRAAVLPTLLGLALSVLAGLHGCSEAPQAPVEPQLNLLMIVADDLAWDSVGAYGADVLDATPNIDQLASEGMRFEFAHVNVSVCQPSRQVLLSGRYPHNSGGEGFHELRVPDVPILPGVLRANGYLVGVMGKLRHSTPYEDFEWDLALTRTELGMGRNPQRYGEGTRQFLEQAQAAGQPFFLMANSHDPHRPFFGREGDRGWYEPGPHVAAPPSKAYERGDCAIPGFLPRLKIIAEEVAAYYGSVRRCDDTVGAVLRALDDAGLRETTLVVFLSDNGMAFPFAKATCYLQGTRTPWIVRWPGNVQAGSTCSDAMISGVDFMPTVLAALGVDAPPAMDGRSCLPLLRGEQQTERDAVFTQYGQTATNGYFPIRCVQTARFGYLFNPWSNGSREFVRAEDATSGALQALVNASAGNEAVADRLHTLRFRELEEFYDLEADPDGLNNLIDSPEHTEHVAQLRARLEGWMERYQDPLLAVYRARASVELREALLDERRAELGSE